MHKKRQFLPCPYGCCDKYNRIKLEHLSILEKSKMCRIHYLNTLNGLLTEIDTAIANKTTRTVINKLANSSCKHFYEILDGLKLPAEVSGVKLSSKEKKSD
jgi:queuine/archaeosine tRNA-ribosyltransferase